MNRSNGNGKPVIDAINDAVGALSELLRSLRTAADRGAKTAKSEAKGTARKVKKDLKRAGAEAKRVGRGLGNRLERAWSALVHENGESKPPAPAKKRPRRRKARAKSV